MIFGMGRAKFNMKSWIAEQKKKQKKAEEDWADGGGSDAWGR